MLLPSRAAPAPTLVAMCRLSTGIASFDACRTFSGIGVTKRAGSGSRAGPALTMGPLVRHVELVALGLLLSRGAE